MTTTTPPMPEIDAVLKLPNEIDGNLEYHNAFTEAKVLARDAEWMERITALEAEIAALKTDAERYLQLRNADMNERNNFEHYAGPALDAALDAARTALENTK